MRKNLLSLLMVILAGAAFGQASSYPNGSDVADFTVTDTEGNVYSLHDITASGKYVFVDFFFDTCGPCQATQPYYNELHDKYGCNDGDIFVISINNGTDNNAEVDAFEATYGGSFHHAPAVSNEGGSSAVNSAFGVGAYPTYCLIGPDNKMVANDIWPISDVSDFEAAFPSGFNPAQMECSFAGIEEDVVSELSVYPNPALAELNISFEATQTSTASVEIINMVGEVVITKNIETTVGENQNILDVDALASGMYIAKISLNDQITTVKFNKQ